MKVSELIEKLHQYDEDAEVYLYVWEDFNHCVSIKTKDQALDEETGLYCKGYTFREHVTAHPDKKFIVLADER